MKVRRQDESNNPGRKPGRKGGGEKLKPVSRGWWMEECDTEEGQKRKATLGNLTNLPWRPPSKASPQTIPGLSHPPAPPYHQVSSVSPHSLHGFYFVWWVFVWPLGVSYPVPTVALGSRVLATGDAEVTGMTCPCPRPWHHAYPVIPGFFPVSLLCQSSLPWLMCSSCLSPSSVFQGSGTNFSGSFSKLPGRASMQQTHSSSSTFHRSELSASGSGTEILLWNLCFSKLQNLPGPWLMLTKTWLN